VQQPLSGLFEQHNQHKQHKQQTTRKPSKSVFLQKRDRRSQLSQDLCQTMFKKQNHPRSWLSTQARTFLSDSQLLGHAHLHSAKRDAELGVHFPDDEAVAGTAAELRKVAAQHKNVARQRRAALGSRASNMLETHTMHLMVG
jgi:hypothetical protein